ncbi:MAG: TadE/TadG family type IV pilus assembly protein [Paracoccaceae bacterium]
MPKLLSVCLRRFVRKTEGTATVESVLWLPIFFLLFGLMLDATMIFSGQSRVLRVVQDANRNLSVGRLDTTADTEAWIIAELANLSDNVTASTSITSGVATTTALIPAVDLEILGMFSSLNSLTISVTSQHFIEF